jgi:CheY-like chemotaxis protein
VTDHDDPEGAPARGTGVALRLRVLVADASRVARQIVAGVLGPRGHDVVQAGSNAELEAALQRQEFDVLLVDLELPDFDVGRGAQMLRQHASPTAASPRFIAMTSDEQAGQEAVATTSAIDGFLVHPFKPAELLKVVEPPSTPAASTAFEPNIDVLDWDEARRGMQGRDDMLRELGQTFLVECENIVTQIREGLARADAATVRRAAHMMKGNANMFCARATSEAARELEYLARDGRLDEAQAAWSTLQGELARLVPTLTRRLKG